MADNNAPEASSTTIVNLNAHVAPIIKNSSSYPSFDLYLIPIYTNNQLCYYHMTSAMLDTNKVAVKNQLKDCKALLKLIDWNENTKENILVEHNLLSQIS